LFHPSWVHDAAACDKIGRSILAFVQFEIFVQNDGEVRFFSRAGKANIRDAIIRDSHAGCADCQRKEYRHKHPYFCRIATLAKRWRMGEMALRRRMIVQNAWG
jgi:hypothetical protein